MRQKNSFVKNASVLMIASLISRMIGLIYRAPLNAIVGDEGMGYYGMTMKVYQILLLIASYSIPMAVSKVVSERLALRQYRNAQRVFHASLLYAVVVGGIVALIALFGAPVLLPSNQPNAVLSLQILAPTIFFSGILGVLRGYFQAHNTMVPTSLSQVIEQIINCIISLLAAWLLIDLCASQTEGSIGKWGAAGSTIGTGAGVIAGLLFMLFVYSVNRGKINRRAQRDMTSHEESFRDVMKIILLMVTPVIFSTFIYNASGYIDSYLFSQILGMKGVDAKVISSFYGEYSNQYDTLINIPLALFSASSTAMVPQISAHYAAREIKKANSKIDEAIMLTMFIAVPASIGLSILGVPIVALLFPGSNGTAGHLLTVGSLAIVFTALSTVTNGVLQGIGKPKVPVRNAAISLALNIIVLLVCLWFFPNTGIYAVLAATIFFAISMCFLNGISMRKYLHYKNQFVNAYGKPFLASIGMGATAFLVYHGIFALSRSNLLGLIAAIPLAMVVYLVLFVLVARVPKEQIVKFPGGRLILLIGRRIGIYR